MLVSWLLACLATICSVVAGPGPPARNFAPKLGWPQDKKARAEKQKARHAKRKLAIINQAVFPDQNSTYTLREGDPAYGVLQGEGGFILKSGYPVSDAWIPSNETWAISGVPTWAPDSTPHHSNIMRGQVKSLVDRDIDTAVYFEHTRQGAWVTFDLKYSFRVSAFKLYTAWTNGPRDTTLHYGTTPAGPWQTAATFTVTGEDFPDSADMELLDKKATVVTNFGQITSRYWRLSFNSTYVSVGSEQLAEATKRDTGTAKRPLVLAEVGFRGLEAVPITLAAPMHQCAWGTTLDPVSKTCMRI